MKKPELLIPASSLEVLKTAVIYGADAVYIGGEAFSLRAKAKNFSAEEMKEGIRFAHAHGVRVHVTANILAHNSDLEGAEAYFQELRELRPDAILVADPGMFMMAKDICPEIDIHISTQANNTNYETFRFWHDLGAKRVVAARELSLRELKEIREKIPSDLELECFVHGAMCISYSGRCLLSAYMTGRNANLGACTHPCRWRYRLCEEGEKTPLSNGGEDFSSRDEEGGISYAVEEESRPGEYMPVFENERGTYIFNSKDLCMIEHIPELILAGVDSLKIEGRMKTALYVATVARTYRKAIDDFLESEEKYRQNLPWYRDQIARCTYRSFTTGFYFDSCAEEAQIYDSNTYVNDYIYLGTVGGAAACAESGMSLQGERIGSIVSIEQRNKFCKGDQIEIMKPDGSDVIAQVLHIYTEEGIEQESAPHPKQKLRIALTQKAEAGDILRMKGPLKNGT